MHYYMLGVLTVSWAFWLWDTYLDYRQYQVYQKTEKVPAELKGLFDEKTFEKSRSYSIDKARFGFVSSLFNQVQSSVVLCCFIMPFFWELSNRIMSKTFGFNNTSTLEWEIFQSLVFTFITSLASTIAGLPLSIYNTFAIEQRHGFNKQTPGFYAWDKIKMFSVSFIISAPILAAVIYIVRNGGPFFFLYLWVFCFIVVLVLTFFHGEIAALFDKFSPLPPGELRTRIEALAEDVKFPLHNIFVVEGSKRSSHSNAYQSGIFTKKRIVIYDTLIEGYHDDKDEDREQKNEETQSKTDFSKSKDEDEDKKKKKGCNNDEIIAVLCHELGHWYCSHLLKFLAFAEVNYLLIFLIFSKLYNDPTLYSAFGFTDERPVIIGFALMMMVLTPYSELQGFISTLISRRFEYQADNYAMRRGYTDKLKSALVKLNIDNLGFPVHDELYSTFNHSHPTLIQRLRALGKTD